MASVLYVGDLTPGGTCEQRLRAMRELGHDVTSVATNPAAPSRFRQSIPYRAANRLFGPFDIAGANSKILEQVIAREFNVLWLDKGLTIRRDKIAACKRARPGMLVVGYSPDDMYARHNQSRQFRSHLALYDAFFTTKSYGVEELGSMGCRNVHFIENGYDPATHRPMEVTDEDRARWGGPVGFIGTWESDRAASLHRLASSGIPVRVWGNSWEHCRLSHPLLKIEGRDLMGDAYARAINCFDINLAFLRKANRDQQTQRSVEIPACGAFMLAERTAEHQALFAEGVEAGYFESDAELIEKVRYYTSNPEKRRDVARAGRERCVAGEYSNNARLKTVFGILGIAGGR